MLAMHYAIPLQDAAQVAAVRTRAAARGPLFDGMPGLGAKLFLLDPANPCYATFYLWREAEAALGFLEGAFFKALVETFGRPEVHLLLTEARALPFVTGDMLTLLANPPQGTDTVLRAHDPRDGSLLALAAPLAAGRRFEVMYRATGAPG